MVTAAVAAIAFAVAACSALTDFSNLSSNGAADGATDADASRATDATTMVDATPANIGDGGGGRDGGADAGASRGFCASAQGLTFCDDFDTPEDGSALGNWDTTSITNSGTIGIDLGNFVSPPASLLATAPAGGTGGQSAVRKAFAGQTQTSVALDLLLEATDQSAYNSVAEIHLDPMPAAYSDYRAALIFTKGAMTLSVYYASVEGGQSETFAPVNVDFSSWHRVQLQLVTTPSPQAQVTDGDGGMYATLPLPADVTGAQGAFATVGLTYVKSNASPWRVRIDNVAVVTSD
jgi:hypothetical protein